VGAHSRKVYAPAFAQRKGFIIQKENNITTGRLRRFAVTGEYSNADDLKPGDVCIVRPGAPYSHGNLVLIECSQYCATDQTTPHYHAQRFISIVNGKKYKFRLARWRSGGGKMYREGEEKIIIGPVLRVARRGAKAEKAKSTETLKRYRAVFEWSLFGIHYGDRVIVNENRQAKLGQLILVKPDSGSYKDSYFARCCLVTSDTVRICGQFSEPRDRPASAIVGAAVELDHADCNHTRIEALRDRLRNMGDDITDSTEAFKIKREIYELEHPIEEEEDSDSDEWPEVIGDE
jgi:hypothetical protein